MLCMKVLNRKCSFRFNMAHDGIHNECSLENNDLHIMTPSFSLNADTWSFSKCSRRYITNFLE